MPAYSIKDLAQEINAEIFGDDSVFISKCASIKNATLGELTFYLGGGYRKFLSDTKASAIILKREDVENCSAKTKLVVQNPELAFAKLVRLFDSFEKPKPGIHASAIISSSAIIDSTVSVGANCFIGENVTIAKNTIILANCAIHDFVSIGSDCFIHSNVTIYHRVTMHNRVILHSGAIIGADGFGLTPNEQGEFIKIPQLGSVEIHNDVEIGANSCIDRGALDNTILEVGVKIDNLVQIAHNVVIGAHTVLAGCSAVSGSAIIGKHCLIGGAVTIGGHLTICDRVILTGCAMVTKSIIEPGVYSSGTGLLPNVIWRKCVARFKRLGNLKNEISK